MKDEVAQQREWHARLREVQRIAIEGKIDRALQRLAWLATIAACAKYVISI